MKRKLRISGWLMLGWMLSGATWAQLPSRAMSVSDAWLRATLVGQDAAAAYMVLSAREPMRLLRVESPLARTVSLHEMTLDGGVMKMRTLSHLDISAGQQVVLKPGSYHLMLTGLKQPLRQGQNVPLRLYIEGREAVSNTRFPPLEVNAAVRSLTAGNTAPAAEAMPSGHHHMH